jgi:hypothetical protein
MRKATVTKSGRKFYPYYRELLDNMPPDLVKEMARRELAKIAESENGKYRKPAIEPAGPEECAITV